MNFRLPRIASLALLAWAGMAAAAPLDDMRSLLEKGQAAPAYEIGRANQDQLGQPLFDFYFGVAAVGSGHAGEGVLALERYVENEPSSLNGRLELARGYFVLGEDTLARQQFDLVLASRPPQDVQASVQRFLDAIRSREVLYRPTASYYFEGGLGYDSNANAGPSSSTNTRWTFAFPQAITAPTRADGFNTLAAGFTLSRPLKPGLFAALSGAIDGKLHHSEADLDLLGGRLDAGLTWIREKDVWRLSGGFSTLTWSGTRFRDVISLGGEWNRQLDELRSVNVFGQYADLGYAGTNSVRDSRLTTIGAGYRQTFVSRLQPLLSASLYGGREEITTQRSDLSRDLMGVRVSASITPAPRWSLQAGYTYQESRFDGGAPPPVGVLLPAEPKRHDEYSALDAALSYAYTSNLSFKAELLHSRNTSTDALMGYKRDIVAFKVRYDFR